MFHDRKVKWLWALKKLLVYPVKDKSSATMTSVIGVMCLLTMTTLDAVRLTAAREFLVGVILPFSNIRLWSIPKVRPAIHYAMETIRNESMLPNDELVMMFRDSKCSETFGPLAAFELVRYSPPNLFLGPACDYAVASIARFSPHWNIPVITGGALVNAFQDKNQYQQLTRIGGSYVKIGNFLVTLFRYFNWSTAMLIYHANLGVRQSHGRTTEHFIMEAVHLPLNLAFNKGYQLRKPIHYVMFDVNASREEAVYVEPEKLMRDASTSARSKNRF